MTAHAAIYIITPGSLGIIGGLVFASWVTGKFCDVGRIRRAIAVCTGLVFAGCSGYFAYIATESKILTGITGFIGGAGGAAALLWWITKSREPLKLHKLIGAGSLSLISFLFAAGISAIIAFCIASNIMKTNIEPVDGKASAAPMCAQRLRALCLAQKNFNNVNGKFATLDELAESRFFDRERLDPVSDYYELKVEASGKDNWTCFATPRLKGSKLPAFRINKTGIIRFRKDGKQPTEKDEVYKRE